MSNHLLNGLCPRGCVVVILQRERSDGAEAVARYLGDEALKTARLRDAKGALGSLDDLAADALEASVRELRAQWR